MVLVVRNRDIYEYIYILFEVLIIFVELFCEFVFESFIDLRVKMNDVY